MRFKNSIIGAMKYSVYIETTIISYYVANLSRDIVTAGRQVLTREWWNNKMPEFDCYISDFVLREISNGNADMAAKRIAAAEIFTVLDEPDEIEQIAERYIKVLSLPETVKTDAYHLAIASWYGLDYIASWNCTHISNPDIEVIIKRINDELGLKTPKLRSIDNLMEVQNV